MRRTVRLARQAVVGSGVVLSLVAIGCESDGSAPEPGVDPKSPAADDRQQVRELYVAFTSAIEARDYRAACAGLTPALRHELSGRSAGCPDGLRRSLRGLQSLAEYRPRIVSLKVAGNSATATVRYGPDPQPERFDFSKLDGAWRIGPARR